MAMLMFAADDGELLLHAKLDVIDGVGLSVDLHVHKEATPHGIAAALMITAAELMKAVGSPSAAQIDEGVSGLVMVLMIEDMASSFEEESSSEDEQSSEKKEGGKDDYTAGWSINAN
jgi:GNAT superfamily N-acetyltransferase